MDGAATAPRASGAPHDLPLGDVTGPPTPGSALIGCDRADDRVEIVEPSRLDPSCTWTAGFDLTATGAALDCRGALVSAAAPHRGRRGIHVKAPTDVALSDVAVRNCVVEGFLNNVHVERLGFRSLTPSTGYDDPFADIVVENVVSRDSIGVGIFVNGFVTDVTVQDAEVTGAGSSGIYLDGDSRDNVVTRTHIHHNGHRENGPDGEIRDIGPIEV